MDSEQEVPTQLIYFFSTTQDQRLSECLEYGSVECSSSWIEVDTLVILKRRLKKLPGKDAGVRELDSELLPMNPLPPPTSPNNRSKYSRMHVRQHQQL
jgi:hypothetical protein